MLLKLRFQGANHVTEMSDKIHRGFWVFYKSVHFTTNTGNNSRKCYN